MTSAAHPITIRPADADDDVALHRLAVLDSHTAAPPRPLLLAEVDGEVAAALSITSRQAIADPFRRTAHLLKLLELQAEQP